MHILVINLIRHVLNNIGTPKHPGIPVNTYAKALAASLGLGLLTRESGLQGESCYDADMVQAHAPYAFNAYYH
ncbi:hypothetical protein EJ110_NYTH31521 [Nymphaea thermarum]|nr:hypothetical protein EJ110_NYTH31521 [Nymphaea thermarum]